MKLDPPVQTAPHTVADYGSKGGRIMSGGVRNLPVLVINLDREPQRLERMQTRLDTLGIPFNRLPATDGNHLGEVDRNLYYSESLNRRRYHRPLSAAEIGCYISHLRAWQWLLDHGHERAVILEDDVVFGEDFRTAIDLLPRLPQPWDVVKLGAFRPKPILHSFSFGPFTLHQYVKPPVSTFAQAVSRSGAEKLLHARIPFGRPVDIDLQHVWETDLVVCGLEPYPVSAGPEKSGRNTRTDDTW